MRIRIYSRYLEAGIAGLAAFFLAISPATAETSTAADATQAEEQKKSADADKNCDCPCMTESKEAKKGDDRVDLSPLKGKTVSGKIAIGDLTAKMIDFGCTDAPMSKKELAAAKEAGSVAPSASSTSTSGMLSVLR